MNTATSDFHSCIEWRSTADARAALHELLTWIVPAVERLGDDAWLGLGPALIDWRKCWAIVCRFVSHFCS